MSRAEIQRAYRQRLKEKDNIAYLEKNRERMKRKYVPSSELSENDRKKRNLKNREKLRRFYNRKREERLVHNHPDQPESSGYKSGKPSTPERGRIRVRTLKTTEEEEHYAGGSERYQKQIHALDNSKVKENIFKNSIEQLKEHYKDRDRRIKRRALLMMIQ